MGDLELRPLGRTGMTVTSLCLGTMMFGAWGNRDHDECVAMVHEALDAGINFVDTADVYAFGETEEIVRKALAGRRDDVILATKFNNPLGTTDPNQRGNSRRWIMRAVEDSLRRLGTDWIDLYQVHRPDPSTDIEETISALSDLVSEGKIRAYGTSTFPADALVEAQWAAARLSVPRPTTEQPPYSILSRGIERDVLPACLRYRLGVLVWAPLNGGWLTGKYRANTPAPVATRATDNPDHFDFGGPAHDAKIAAVEALLRLAGEAGITLVDLAHAFVLAHPAVTSAIIGPKTPAQLRQSLQGAGTRLDAAVLDRIDEIVAPGTNLNPIDAGYLPPSVTDPATRRRPGG